MSVLAVVTGEGLLTEAGSYFTMIHLRRHPATHLTTDTKPGVTDLTSQHFPAKFNILPVLGAYTET